MDMMGIANATTSTLNQTIGSYHALMAHVLMAIFAAALVCDVLAYFGKARALQAAHWLVIVGVVACMPVLFTGMAAAQAADVHDPFLARHITLGYTTAVATSLYAGFRIAAMWWHLQVPASFYLMATIIIVALISWTADYGWLFQVPHAGA